MNKNYEIKSVVKEDGKTKFYVDFEGKYYMDMFDIDTRIDYLTNCVCSNSMEIEMGENKKVAEILEKENEDHIAELTELKEAKKHLQMEIYNQDKKERKEAVLAKVSTKENMEKLFDYIRELTGMPYLKFDYEVVERKYDEGKYISFDSELINNPLMDLAFKEVRISNFNSGFSVKEDYWGERDYSKMAESVGYFVSIQFSYKHWDGGTNGANIAEAYLAKTVNGNSEQQRKVDNDF